MNMKKSIPEQDNEENQLYQRYIEGKWNLKKKGFFARIMSWFFGDTKPEPSTPQKPVTCEGGGRIFDSLEQAITIRNKELKSDTFNLKSGKLIFWKCSKCKGWHCDDLLNDVMCKLSQRNPTKDFEYRVCNFQDGDNRFIQLYELNSIRQCDGVISDEDILAFGTKQTPLNLNGEMLLLVAPKSPSYNRLVMALKDPKNGFWARGNLTFPIAIV
jgi:hypothetical protein